LGYLRALAVILAMVAALPVIIASAAAPANDNFVGAIVVPKTLSYNNTQSVLESTFQTVDGEPQPSCAVVAHTVWYSFTPNQSDMLKIDTAGSGYDTVLAVYTGGSLGGLTSVGCNDETGAGQTSALQFQTTSGTTYQIQIGSVDSVPANPNLALSLEWGTTPANDNFANAITASPLLYTDSQSTIVATTNTGEPPTCLGNVISRTV